MWACDGEYLDELSGPGNRILMASDFTGGSSGGPWLLQLDGEWVANGIQAGKPYDQSGDYSNSAWFGAQVDALVAWAADQEAV